MDTNLSWDEVQKNYICVIVCYFGCLPKWFSLWERSAAYNKRIDFILITDQDIESSYVNIKVVKTSLLNVKRQIEDALNIDCVLDKPYKLCDYRPMFGLIFYDLIQQYDYWGHCDLDQIFGDIYKFVEPVLQEGYLKIYELGHLTFYRNNSKGNNLFRLKGRWNWKEIASTTDSCYFDEVGVRDICKFNGIKVYTNKDYADISPHHKRFTLSNDLLTRREKKNNNYNHQVFFWEKGKIFRVVSTRKGMQKKEYSYIHFQKRKMEMTRWGSYNSFFITANCFLEKKEGILTTSDLIQVNPYNGFIYEMLEDFVKLYKEYKKRLIIKLSRYLLKKNK